MLLGALTNYKKITMKKLSLLALRQAKNQSINNYLCCWTIKNASVEVLDLNDYEMPVYSMDKEESGIHNCNRFYNKLEPPTYL
jgi:hypothetical protein